MWYAVTSCILALFVAVICVIIIAMGGVVGSDNGGRLGSAIGLVLGGGLSALVFSLFLIRRALYVGGAYLLSTALVTHGSEYEWDRGRLIIGGLLLLVALLTKSRASTSRSRKSKD